MRRSYVRNIASRTRGHRTQRWGRLFKARVFESLLSEFKVLTLVTASRHEEVIYHRACRNGCVVFFWKPVDGNICSATIVSLAHPSSERSLTLSTRPRVLIADDHPDMVEAVSRLLALDCEVVGVTDGTALLETAQRLQPDVIVLDVNLPNVHSLEACREITRANPAMKVIVFTAMDEPSVRQAFVEAGATAYVWKLAASDLLPTIQRLCVDRASADSPDGRRSP